MNIKLNYTPIKIALFCFFLSACGGGSTNETTKPIEPVNTPPSITSIGNHSIKEQSQFIFTAQASDSDGTITSYVWEQTSGTEVIDLVSDSETLTFLAPDISTNETISFKLIVTDNNNASATETLNIDVIANSAPVIASMESVTINERAEFEFTADVSVQDGIINSYLWQQLEGTEVNINGVNSNKLAFTAPNITSDEKLVFSLTAVDDFNNETTSNITINVNAFDEINYGIIIDPGLKKCLKQNNLDLGLNTISCDNIKFESLSELNNFPLLTTVNITNAELTDVNALKNFKQLKSLDLSNNQITDVTTLTSLIKLESLNLANNRISLESLVTLLPQLSALKSLNLESYHLFNNNYSYLDIEHLTRLVQLEQLNLNNVRLNNTSKLKTFEKLTHLELEDIGYRFNSLSFLASLPKLTVLNIGKNIEIKDLSALTQLPQLVELNLSDIKNDDYSPLSSLVNLKKIDLSKTYYRDRDELNLNNLSQLIQLTELNISNNSITNISTIENFTQLETLTASRIDIGSIAAIENLTKIKTLDLSQNSRLADISPLKSLINLVDLNLSGNQNLDDLFPLSSLVNLKQLNISDVRNIDINLSPLAKLTNLTNLDASKNNVINIDSLAELKLLEILKLNNTNLNQLFDFSQLTKLIELDLSYNNLIELKTLAKATELIKLNLTHNTKLTALTGLEELTKLSILEAEILRELTDISALKTLNNLKYLNLYNAEKLVSVAALKYSHKLTELSLNSMSSLEDISSLNSLINLITLNIQDNPRILCSQLDELKTSLINTEIRHSSNCVNNPVNKTFFNDDNLLACVLNHSFDIDQITYLSCTYDNITNLSGMEQLIKLTTARLYNNNIADITPLSRLSNLSSLRLDYNEIKDLSPLSNLIKLNSLDLSSNEISDISPLSNLIKLNSLNLTDNKITDVSSLMSLIDLNYLNLQYNSGLDCEQLSNLQITLINTYRFYKPSHCN